MNACERAKEKGADVVKQWDASLDGRTRDSHRQVDGEIRELDEKFSNGLMFPSDPSGRAEEVINCRCGLLQRARWAVGGEITKWAEDAPVLIDDNGTTQLVKIDEKNYNSFKEKYYEAVDRSVIEGISTSNGITVQSVSRHQFERMNERGITVGDVKNALTSPLHIGEIIIGDNGKPSQRFIGENVTVNINPETGNVVTTWKTGKRILNKYKGGE